MIMGQEIAQGNERKVVVAVLRKEEVEEVEAEVMVIKVTVVVSEAFDTKTFRKTILEYCGLLVEKSNGQNYYRNIYIYMIVANLLKEQLLKKMNDSFLR